MRAVVPRIPALLSRALALPLVLCALAACPAPRPAPAHPLPPPGGSPGLTWTRVTTPDQVPSTPPAPGTYRLHLIDVGTGLAILIQGADFTMLYDAGSNDREEKPLRVAAYLAAALGPSGDDLCVDAGRARADRAPRHRSGGALAPALRPRLRARSRPPLLRRPPVLGLGAGQRHRVLSRAPRGDRANGRARLSHRGRRCPTITTSPSRTRRSTIPTWERFSEGDVVPARRGRAVHDPARRAEAPPRSEPELGRDRGRARHDPGAARRRRGVGAAQGPELSGRRRRGVPARSSQGRASRRHPAGRPPRLEDLEPPRRSSRRSIRSLALVSSGPKRYGKTALPDAEVLDELRADNAQILRTDEHDDGCPTRGKIGGDDGPGGCDSWVITIGP